METPALDVVQQIERDLMQEEKKEQAIGVKRLHSEFQRRQSDNSEGLFDPDSVLIRQPSVGTPGPKRRSAYTSMSPNFERIVGNNFLQGKPASLQSPVLEEAQERQYDFLESGDEEILMCNSCGQL